MEKRFQFNKGKAFFGTEGIPCDVEEYETTDIYEGAYLLSLGMKITKVKTNNRGRKLCVFEGEDVKNRVLGFVNDERVPVKTYAQNVIYMKERVKR